MKRETGSMCKEIIGVPASLGRTSMPARRRGAPPACVPADEPQPLLLAVERLEQEMPAQRSVRAEAAWA
jgi:hypothetical protein